MIDNDGNNVAPLAEPDKDHRSVNPSVSLYMGLHNPPPAPAHDNPPPDVQVHLADASTHPDDTFFLTLSADEDGNEEDGVVLVGSEV